VKQIDPKFVADLDQREPAADPEDCERRRVFENQLFVEFSRGVFPIGSPKGWYVIGANGRIHRVKG